MIDRAAFVARWQARAAETEDPFDQFFYLWIAAVIHARPQLDLSSLSSDGTDRAALLRLGETNVPGIAKALSDASDQLVWLAHRRGTLRGDPIVDVHDHHPEHLRGLFRCLSEHYIGSRNCKAGRVVEATAELLNHVRNNLFHGIKDPTDVDDAELVQHLVPVIQAFLKGTGA